MKEKIKNLVVSPSAEYVIWAEDLSNVVREATLTVSAGCVALYLVNGALKSINTPGRWVIKSKAEEKENAMLQLICVNTDKTFEICCGVGNVPFKDYEINCETVVGARGECKIRIAQPWPLYTTFGHVPITSDEIDSYVKLKLGELMTSRLADVLQRYDYNSIMTQQSVIADDLLKKFSQSLNDIGIEVVSFALAGIMFNPEYQEARRAFFDNQNRRKEEKEERRNREREQRAEIDNIVAIANATRNMTPPPAPGTPPAPGGYTPPAPGGYTPPAPGGYTPPAPGYGGAPAVSYCPKCGNKITNSAIFCPVCGKKL